MKGLIKNIGILIQLVGVALLIVPKIMETTSNTTLMAGGACLVVGIIAHMLINKNID